MVNYGQTFGRRMKTVSLPADFIQAELLQEGCDVWIVLRDYAQAPYRYVVNGWVEKDQTTFDCHYFCDFDEAEADFLARALR